MPPSLPGRAQKAQSQPPSRCRTLSGRRHADVWRDWWRALKQHAASGVDRGRAPAYAHHLEDHLKPLGERLQSQRSRATRVRRPSRPQGGGPVRPRGRPVVEDTLGPLALTRLRTAIYAQAFLRCREGSRPPVGAREAVDAWTSTRPWGRDHWGGEADLPGVCATSAPAGLLRRLAERLADRARRRLRKPWRTAGGLDTDGTVRPPATGSPPGGGVAPSLATVS